MLKILLRQWTSFINTDNPLETKIFQLVATCGLFATVLGALLSAVVGLGFQIVSVTLAGTVGILVPYYIGMRYRKIDICSCIMVLILNCVFIPAIFFTGGGVYSGSNIWFVLSLFSAFLLLKGRILWVTFTLSLLCMWSTYLLAYRHPEYVLPIGTAWEAYVDVVNSILLVALICGLFVLFQRKLYEREQSRVEEQNQEIAQLYQTKNRFFANMSHEIRTPINTIIGLNEMILREEVSDEIAENAIHIQEASKMLLALINDILDMSKLESGKMEIVPVQYETGRLFSELVNLVWIRAHEKKLEFKVDVSPELPSMLFGDEVRIKQIMTNLLTNAVKYTTKGSVTLIARGERVENNRIRLIISVRDTGVGIRKEDMQNLFQSFRRMDERIHARIEGTGLGLSISGQLAEMMGGKITVNSVYQRGSVFTLQIEQNIVDVSPMGQMGFMRKAALGRRNRYRQSFEAPEARVLIVDDNETNLLVAKKLLRETKVQIDTARSGKECLELTRLYYYHVIFMDQLMPEMGGVETLTQLRKQENGLCRESPVIALTANVMSGAEQTYRDIGFDGYLAKPINSSLLEATLLKHLPKEVLEYYDLPAEADETDDIIQVFSESKKKKIHITTDCICDLSREYLERYDIGMMHYYIRTDQARFADGPEISSNHFLEYLENNNAELITECASVEEYETFFSNALGVGEQIIHISASYTCSAGFERATAAAQGFDNVTVMDSGHVSGGMGMMVLYAAKLAQNGCSVQEILESLEEVKGRIYASMLFPTTDNLYRNGRVSGRVKKLCDMLQLQLVVNMKGGEMVPVSVKRRKIRNMYYSYIHNAMKRDNADTRIVFVTHTGCTVRQLQEFRREIEKYRTFDQVVMQKSSATISCNSGLGAIGIVYVKKSTI